MPPTPPAIAPAKIVPPGLAARSTQQVFTAHEKTAATLTSSRAASQHSATQLQQARVTHHQVADRGLDTRLVDLICKELVVEFTGEAQKSRAANQDQPLAPPIAAPAGASQPMNAAPAQAVASGSVKAAQAIELIEKIETFIKDNRRPAIALTLNNSLGAKVEIERVGPREVALKVIGHRGPPGAEDIGRIRDELRAHGLKISALSVA